jgi:hypothetical protein
MPRISREAAAAKEAFVLGLFATNPATTPKEVQEKVKAQFGGAMNADKVKELRDRLLTKDSPIVTTAPETEQVFSPPEPVAEPVSAGPAPKPEAVVVPVDPVLIPMEQVTDQNGAYIRKPTPTEGTERQIAPGLVEVVK